MIFGKPAAATINNRHVCTSVTDEHLEKSHIHSPELTSFAPFDNDAVCTLYTFVVYISRMFTCCAGPVFPVLIGYLLDEYLGLFVCR